MNKYSARWIVWTAFEGISHKYSYSIASSNRYFLSIVVEYFPGWDIGRTRRLSWSRWRVFSAYWTLHSTINSRSASTTQSLCRISANNILEWWLGWTSRSLRIRGYTGKLASKWAHTFNLQRRVSCRMCQGTQSFSGSKPMATAVFISALTTINGSTNA